MKSSNPYMAAVGSMRKPKGRSSAYPTQGKEKLKVSTNKKQLTKAKGARGKFGSGKVV